MRRFFLGGSVLAGVCLGAMLIMAFTAAKADSVPVGTIIAWGGEAKAIPANWKLCDGSALLRSRYQELFQAIGTAWGAPNAKKFYLPDLRGRFVRGADEGSGRDPDADKRESARNNANSNGVGSIQSDSFQNHTHELTEHTHMSIYRTIDAGAPVNGGSTYSVILALGMDYGYTTPAKGNIYGAKKCGTNSSLKKGEETRPINAAVNFIIKVK